MEQGTEGGKEMKIPEGWPTEEMIEAGVLEMLGRSFDKMIPVSESVIGIFKAMLAAAPTPPTPNTNAPYITIFDNGYDTNIEDETFERLVASFIESIRPKDETPPAQDEPVPMTGYELICCGVSRQEWHDKAWALFHSKTFEDTQLSKVNIHTIRTVFDATFDALPHSSAVK